MFKAKFVFHDVFAQNRLCQFFPNDLSWFPELIKVTLGLYFWCWYFHTKKLITFKSLFWCWFQWFSKPMHCVKSLRIRSYSGPYFPAFGNNNQLICENCNNHPQNIILKFVNFYLNRNLKLRMYFETLTAQKMKFFIIDFFSECDKTRRKLRIWSHLLKTIFFFV